MRERPMQRAVLIEPVAAHPLVNPEVNAVRRSRVAETVRVNQHYRVEVAEAQVSPLTTFPE